MLHKTISAIVLVGSLPLATTSLLAGPELRETLCPIVGEKANQFMKDRQRSISFDKAIEILPAFKNETARQKLYNELIYALAERAYEVEPQTTPALKLKAMADFRYETEVDCLTNGTFDLD